MNLLYEKGLFMSFPFYDPHYLENYEENPN